MRLQISWRKKELYFKTFGAAFTWNAAWLNNVNLFILIFIRFLIIFAQFRVLSPFADSGSGIRVLSLLADSGSKIRVLSSIADSGSGIRVLSSFADSGGGIRVLFSFADSPSGVRFRYSVSHAVSVSAFYPNPPIITVQLHNLKVFM